MMKHTIFFNQKTKTFSLNEVNGFSYVYFPITNGYNLKSSITPTLGGDIKTDQNHFALPPVSQEDLHQTLYGRHFWLNIENKGLYNVSGISARQKYENTDVVNMEGGFLYFKVTRINEALGIQSTITTFSPYEDENIELSKVVIKNNGQETLSYSPTLAVPLYSRSADSIRDHRHVTALLNRATIVKNGIINKPTLSFDERGHVKNDISYGVFINGQNNEEAIAYNPKLQDFVGEGGTLDWPKSLKQQKIGSYQVGDTCDGFEVIGAIQLPSIELKPNEEYTYVFAITMSEHEQTEVPANCNIANFDQLLNESQQKWQEKLSAFEVQTNDSQFDSWVKWVSLQPILRRIYGCSFLPHHDYGRGGRGWRDLWQDCLALILMESQDVEHLLYNNFAGVRIDGSNATIIGSKPGEFIADRNNIPRLWMDHGVWPWNTTKLYVERSGNMDFLFKKQHYFKDSNIYFAKKKDTLWNDQQGSNQLIQDGSVYEGTILEHILVQHLTQFYNVGEHNIIRLEGADWNDGLDMARDRGESVTFTSFYMMNLRQIKELLMELKTQGVKTIEVFKELQQLILDDINYDDINAKHDVLESYFASVTHQLGGDIVALEIDQLIQSLDKKEKWLAQFLRQNEWLEEVGFYNGYYDNHGNRLEGNHHDQIRMTLTGQVFPIMSGLATNDQVEKILESSKKYLFDQQVGGYRLNTNFNEVKLDMGRLFGFAYGHKENGAMFSHMAMMFANGLYQRGFVQDGYDVMNTIYEHCNQFDVAKILPGIPEYIDPDGRGMYHYLTGSASWYILNVVNEMFGIKGQQGNLYLQPKLVKNQFDQNQTASITTEFNNRKVTIMYINENNKDCHEYQVKRILVNENEIEFNHASPVIDKKYLNDSAIMIRVYLQ